MSDTGNGSTAYDIVKKYTEEKVGSSDINVGRI